MSPANIELAIKGGQPLIGQIVAIGDRRPYNVALVVLDRDGAAAFARDHGLEHHPYAELSRRAEVRAAVQAAIDAGNACLSRVEQIKRFTILDHDWATGGEELTPTLKLKRHEIEARYATEIDALYEAATVAGLKPEDDLRHRLPGGASERESLFFTLVMPDEELGVFVYTWVDRDSVAGRLVFVWGPDERPLAFDVTRDVPMGDADFDDWRIDGLRLRHTDPLSAAEIRFRGEGVEIAYDFVGSHGAFDYARNKVGCPQWMARNRLEQSGIASGELRIGDRRMAFERPAHRDHSWGRRDWGMPQHWKWAAAQTASGGALNLFQSVVRGELATNGYVLRDGEPVGLVDARCRAEYDEDMTSRALRAELFDEAGGVTELELVRFSSVRLPAGPRTVVQEAACRGAIDGEPASGQLETLWPSSYLEHLTASRR
jgi:hypothetical protein